MTQTMATTSSWSEQSGGEKTRLTQTHGDPAFPARATAPRPASTLWRRSTGGRRERRSDVWLRTLVSFLKPSCLTCEGATDAAAVQRWPSLLRSLPVMTRSVCVSSKWTCSCRDCPEAELRATARLSLQASKQTNTRKLNKTNKLNTRNKLFWLVSHWLYSNSSLGTTEATAAVIGGYQGASLPAGPSHLCHTTLFFL